MSPGKSEKSVLNTLKKQGIIDKEVLAISLEANEHHITFGSIELPKLNSSDVTNHTLHYFSNLDNGGWAVMMDHISYDGDPILPEYEGLEGYVPIRLAYIDSANSSIQIPESEFNLLKERLMKDDDSIK